MVLVGVAINRTDSLMSWVARGELRYNACMHVRRKKVAIFDIDGTIFRSSLLIELVEELIQAGIFKPRVRRIYPRDKTKWEGPDRPSHEIGGS